MPASVEVCIFLDRAELPLPRHGLPQAASAFSYGDGVALRQSRRVATTMNEITPYPVFVGHAADGRAVKELLDQGIRAVVQLAAEEPPIVTPRDLVFCRFPLEDGSGNDADLLSLAITSVAHLVSRGVPTLVCCGAGMSRSPAVVAAALSIIEHRDPGDAPEVRHAAASRRRGAGILERRLPRGRDASGRRE